MFHITFFQISVFDWLSGRQKRVNFRTKSYVFYSGRIRTLVAMATYSSHRLIMGKVEICSFYCLNGDIWIFFTEMFIE